MRHLRWALAGLLMVFVGSAALSQSGTESRWNNSILDVLALSIGGTQVTSTAAELNILDGVTSTAAELNILDGVTATATELNRPNDVSARLVAGGATLSLTEAAHDGKTVLFDQATGTALTLPAATGSGVRIKVIVSVAVTSNSHTLACAGTDEFAGVIYQVDTDTSDAVAAYPALAADNFDVITMNGTTTGGLAGDWYEVEDIATGVWALIGYQNANGTVLTPLSAT